MRKVLSLIAVFSMMLGLLAACAAPAAPAAPKAPEASKKITVGVNSENPPWIFMKDGKMTGFEADLVEEFAKRSNMTIEYKSAPFATVLTGVQSGQWDIAMSSIWVKKERMEVMDFADPYYDAQIGLIFPKAKPIAKFEEMKGKVFGSDTGSANESWLKEAMPKYGPYEMKSYDYWIDAVKDMEAGRTAGVVVDAPIALEYIKNNPDSALDMLYIDDYHFAQSLAFKKGSPLLATFNKVENEMKKDGSLKAIHVKWFGSEPPADSSVINVVAPYLPNEKPAIKK